MVASTKHPLSQGEFYSRFHSIIRGGVNITWKKKKKKKFVISSCSPIKISIEQLEPKTVLVWATDYR